MKVAIVSDISADKAKYTFCFRIIISSNTSLTYKGRFKYDMVNTARAEIEALKMGVRVAMSIIPNIQCVVAYSDLTSITSGQDKRQMTAWKAMCKSLRETHNGVKIHLYPVQKSGEEVKKHYNECHTEAKIKLRGKIKKENNWTLTPGPLAQFDKYGLRVNPQSDTIKQIAEKTLVYNP